MGGGSWTTSSFCSYSASRGRAVDSSGTVTTTYATAQDMYEKRSLSPRMDPKGFEVRECRDSAEHPETLPVILALDVTGSMGDSAMEVAKKLNGIVTDITQKAKDAEFCVMAIGDTYCDRAPVQMLQFESDVRIAEAFDDIWFEAGGGRNPWESYTAAWYMAAYRTDLDVWKRGGRGILITLGDEPINPVLDRAELQAFVGKHNSPTDKREIDAKDLYRDVSKKYDVYHVYVDHGTHGTKRKNECVATFRQVMPDGHVFACKVDELPKVVSDIVLEHASGKAEGVVKTDDNGFIDW